MNKKINSILIAVIIVLGISLAFLGYKVVMLRNDRSDTSEVVNSVSAFEIDQEDFTTESNMVDLSGSIVFDGDQSCYLLCEVASELDGYKEKASYNVEIQDGVWKAENVKVKPGNNTVSVFVCNGEDGGRTGVSEAVDVFYDAGELCEVYDEDISFDENSKVNFVNDMVIILFNADVPSEKKEAIFEEINGVVVGRSGGEIYQVKIGKKSLDELKKICENLNNHEEVLYAHVDYADVEVSARIKEYEGISDSKKAYECWTKKDGNWGYEAIEADAAKKYSKYFSHISVGVADTGFDLDHNDLLGVFRPSTDWMESINNYKVWSDEENKEINESHGTHVAGTIAANNDKKGVTGILDDVTVVYTDWQPNQTNDKQSWTTSVRVLASLNYSVEAGAKVINYSCGESYEFDNNEFVNDFNSDKASINNDEKWKDEQSKVAGYYMLNLLRKGEDFLVVKSSGNGIMVEVEPDKKNIVAVDTTNDGLWASVTEDNVPGDTPEEKQAVLDRIIIVGNAQKSEDGSYVQNETSNGGNRVDICAPGTDIYSTTVENSYGYKSGTSMAAPHVTAVCAMVWSVNEAFTGADVKNIVCSSTSKTVADNTSENHPLVDTYDMLNAKLSVEKAVSITEKSIMKNKFTLTARSEKGNENFTYTIEVYKKPTWSDIISGKSGLTSKLVLSDVSKAKPYEIELTDGKYKIRLSDINNPEKYIEKDIEVSGSVKGALGNLKLDTDFSDVIVVVLDNKETTAPQTTNEKVTQTTTEVTTEKITQTTTKNSEPEDLSSLSYEMREKKYELKTTGGILYSTISYVYPYFFGNSDLAEKLNKEYDGTFSSYTALSKEEVDEMYIDALEKNLDNGMPFFKKTEIEVTYNRNGYISLLEKTSDWSKGAAHIYNYENGRNYLISDASEKSYSYFLMGTATERTLFLDYLADESGDAQNRGKNWQDNSAFVLTQNGVRFYINVGDAVSRKILDIPYTNNAEPFVEIVTDESRLIKEQLVSKLWFNKIQSVNIYKFLEDGRVIHNPDTIIEETTAYLVVGDTLILYFTDTVSVKLKLVSKHDNYNWQVDSFFYGGEYELIKDDELFFYETDYLVPQDLGNVIWLRSVEYSDESSSESNEEYNEIISRYIDYIEMQNIYTFSDVTFECEDITGDGLPELIFEQWNDRVVVCTYDSTKGVVEEIFSENMAKGNAMESYFSRTNKCILAPSANTGGSRHSLYTFDGSEFVQTAVYEYFNPKGSPTGQVAYYVNGDLVSEDIYSEQLEKEMSEMQEVDNSITQYETVLYGMKR